MGQKKTQYILISLVVDSVFTASWWELLFKKILFIFSARGKQGERRTETSMFKSVAPRMPHNQGPDLQARHGPWPESSHDLSLCGTPNPASHASRADEIYFCDRHRLRASHGNMSRVEHFIFFGVTGVCINLLGL